MKPVKEEWADLISIVLGTRVEEVEMRLRIPGWRGNPPPWEEPDPCQCDCCCAAWELEQEQQRLEAETKPLMAGPREAWDWDAIADLDFKIEELEERIKDTLCERGLEERERFYW